MGRPPKPKHLRQNRERQDLGAVVPFGGKIPEAPTGLLKATVERWESFWKSSLSGTVALQTDLPALRRLFLLYDERDRASREFRKKRIVNGSMGQPVVNPVAKLIKDLDQEIRQLEDRFGLSPMARLKLGVIFGQAHQTLEDINASYEADDIAPDPEVIRLIEGTEGSQVDRGQSSPR